MKTGDLVKVISHYHRAIGIGSIGEIVGLSHSNRYLHVKFYTLGITDYPFSNYYEYLEEEIEPVDV